MSIATEAAPAAVLAASAALRTALQALDPAVVTGPDCARIAEDLAITEKACASARLLSAARAVDAGAHLGAGFRDGAAWLARQSGTTGQQAKRDLATAERLGECPATRKALLDGEISLAQAAEIAQAETETPGAEDALLPLARTADLTQLRDRARQERQARTAVEDLHARQHAARYFRHWRDQLGMVCFAGALPPKTGVAFVNRLEQAAARARRAASERERWEAHAADAFAELCTANGGVGRAGRPELVVVADLFAWRRGHTHPGEVCHLIDGGPIPIEVARELSADAFIKAVLHDGTTIHTVKHFGRHLPAELRTALDLGAVPEFTGRQCAACGTRWGLEYDHIDPVANHGPTSYDNLQALCWADHQEKTRRERRGATSGCQSRAGPDP